MVWLQIWTPKQGGQRTQADSEAILPAQFVIGSGRMHSRRTYSITDFGGFFYFFVELTFHTTEDENAQQNAGKYRIAFFLYSPAAAQFYFFVELTFIRIIV